MEDIMIPLMLFIGNLQIGKNLAKESPLLPNRKLIMLHICLLLCKAFFDIAGILCNEMTYSLFLAGIYNMCQALKMVFY
jgi:hypothetical protein